MPRLFSRRSESGGPAAYLCKRLGDAPGLSAGYVAMSWVSGNVLPLDVQSLGADLCDCEFDQEGAWVVAGDHLCGGFAREVYRYVALGPALAEDAADGSVVSVRILGDVCWPYSPHDGEVRRQWLEGLLAAHCGCSLGMSFRCAFSWFGLSWLYTGPSNSVCSVFR